MVNYHYYRSGKSDNLANPASIDILTRSIILFDPFFKATNKDQILVYESGHYLYSKPDEDYANHLELYLNDKFHLKSRNPKVYDLFEKRFKK